MLRIDVINFLTAMVWRLIKLLSSLILAGVCFVFFLFMAVCVIVILFGGRNHNYNYWRDNEEERTKNDNTRIRKMDKSNG